jgi:3-oxoacyl-[acyl-carrier protein] reductase
MDLGLANHRVLVGGATRGLGAAIARALAGEGARIAAMARPSPALDATAAGLDAVPVGVDLLDPDAPAAAVRAAVDALGGLDGLVVNTGGPPAGTFAEIDEAAWQKAISNTLLSSLRLVRAALPHLRDGRDPAILIVLSSSVREPVAGLVTSNTLRPGLAGLVKSLVPEIAPIRINGIAPGRFETDRVRELDEIRAARAGSTLDDVKAGHVARIPLGRYGDPDELGRVAAFLLSPAASYLTGVILPVDGGMVRSLP